MSKCNIKIFKNGLSEVNASGKLHFLNNNKKKRPSFVQKSVHNTINISLDLLLGCLKDKDKLDIISIFYWIKSISGSSSIKCDTNTLSGLSSGLMISKDKLRRIMSIDLFGKLISIRRDEGMVVANKFVTSGKQVRMVVSSYNTPGDEGGRPSYHTSVPMSYKGTRDDLLSIKLISDINDQQKALSTVKGDVVRGIHKNIHNDIDIYTGKSMKTISMDLSCSVSKARMILDKLIKRGYITKRIRRQDLFKVGDNSGTGMDKKIMREDIASSYNTRNGKIINGKLATYIQFSNEYRLSGYLLGGIRMRFNRRCSKNERIINNGRDIYDAYLPDISAGGVISCVETYDVSDGTITNIPTTTMARGTGFNISDDIKKIEDKQDRLLANSRKWVDKLVRGNNLSGKDTVCYPGGFSSLKICNKINNIISSSYSLENGSIKRVSSKEAFDIIKEREEDRTISHVVSTYQLDDIILAAKNDISKMNDMITSKREKKHSLMGYRIVGGMGINIIHDTCPYYDDNSVITVNHQGFDRITVSNDTPGQPTTPPDSQRHPRTANDTPGPKKNPWCDTECGYPEVYHTPGRPLDMDRTS